MTAGQGGRGRAVVYGLMSLLAVAAGGLVLADLQTWVRPLVVLAFFTAVPGGAVVGLLRLGDVAAETALGLSLSLTVGVAAAQVMLWLHRWDPAAAVVVLALAAAPLLARHTWTAVTTERSRSGR